MDKKGNGLLKKAKPISLSPCSDKDESMWGSPENPISIPQVLISQDTSNSLELEMPTSKMANISREKKDKSPLEATFTHHGQPLEDDASSEQKANKQRKKTTDYTALEFISSSSQANSLTISSNADDKQLTHDRVHEDEKITTALIALFASLFSPLWSLGMAYWHFASGDPTGSLMSLVIFGVSTLVVHMAYFTAKSSPKKDMWKNSKSISLLCAVPGLPSITLSACNVIFAMRENSSRSYERPWANARFVFLAESLALAFPHNVLQLVLLSEDPDLIHSLRGYMMIVGIGIFSFTMTFARFRHDSQNRYERFGNGFEKYVRFTYTWANKVLWFVSYTLVIMSLRLTLPIQKTTTTIVGIGLMLALLEVPILLSMTPALSRFAQSILGLFMMIPQFVYLAALIMWVNVDPHVYNYDNGCFVLGMFFYAESIALTGWLYDRCTGREIDFIPVYPHFFGDLMTTRE